MLTDKMVAAFWASLTQQRRKKWSARMKTGLSDKRKQELHLRMTEFFARQKGPMKDLARAKRAEYQTQLEALVKEAQKLEYQMNQARVEIQRLHGAVMGIDKLLADSEPKPKPELKLVPPLPPALEMNPEPEVPKEPEPA